QEDHLERHDHRQQTIQIMLDTEPNPAAKPDDMNVDESHRAGEHGDPVGDPVLGTLGTHAGVFCQRRVREHVQPVARSGRPSSRDGHASRSGTACLSHLASARSDGSVDLSETYPSPNPAHAESDGSEATSAAAGLERRCFGLPRSEEREHAMLMERWVHDADIDLPRWSMLNRIGARSGGP